MLNDNKITGAKNVLLLIVSGTNEVTLDEIGEVNDYIQTEAGYDANIIMGIGEDESLAGAISVTIVATGFAADQQNTITNTEVKKIVHTLENEQKATYSFSDNKIKKTNALEAPLLESSGQKIVHILEDDVQEKVSKTNLIFTSDSIKKTQVVFDEIDTSLYMFKNLIDQVEQGSTDKDFVSKIQTDFMDTVKLFEYLMPDEETTDLDFLEE